MKPIQRYGLDVLRPEFEAVGKRVREPTTVYLIGGCAMSFAKLKTATKDIDLVLPDAGPMRVLKKALEDERYKPLTNLGRAYDDLAADAYYGKEGAPQFDLFVKRVCRKLFLSPGMMARSIPVELDSGKLRVQRVAPWDIFIFKSITERVADREDMDSIFAARIDWNVVLNEMEWQSNHSQTAWSGAFLDAMEEFDQAGNPVPILDKLRALRDRDVAEHFLIHAVRNGDDPLAQFREHAGTEVEYAQSVLNDLLQRGVLRRVGKKFTIENLPWLDV